MNTFFIRTARISEQKELEDLQLRASLNNPGDRDAMLAHPDAIELPKQQITGGRVFVAEKNGAIVDLQRWSLERMGKANWMDCLLIQKCNGMELDDFWLLIAPSSHVHKDLLLCM